MRFIKFTDWNFASNGEETWSSMIDIEGKCTASRPGTEPNITYAKRGLSYHVKHEKDCQWEHRTCSVKFLYFAIFLDFKVIVRIVRIVSFENENMLSNSFL